MLVYRVCSQQEVEMIFDKGIENVGSPNNGTDVNSHSYQYNVNYLHFFLYKSDILHIKSNKGSCICTYDIPREILDLYCGVGNYMDFINFKERCYAIEFTIPTKELQMTYLKKVDVLLQYIDYEDFLGGGISPVLYETIYDSSKPFLRERKKEECSS